MAIAAIIAVAALLIWGFGSIIARLAGAIAVLEGLLRIGITGSTPAAYAILVAGLTIWMTGHWLWAFKHKAWRTRLALTAYSLPGLHHLAPIPTNRIKPTPNSFLAGGGRGAFTQYFQS
ncbi:hypothetical protein [Rhodococcus qingshengii]|uniref:hypothetical protein n=1 Tax=Rhodococcus qingshengii TaxID=334542 RepID=UPI00237C9CB5|nr:hypothetical protein [Rhodococcus qingshengii]WCT06245.1 hypothetical protein PI247_31680 [Rhodococcus qingshengii]